MRPHRGAGLSPSRFVTLGTLLPDLIDKALYYGARVHLVTTTRTFGHTGLALVIVWALARRHRALLGIAAGATTHVLLDLALDLIAPASRGPSSAWIALTWPLHGLAFPADPYTGLTSHLTLLLGDPRIVISEIIGVMLTVWALRHQATYDHRSAYATPRASPIARIRNSRVVKWRCS